MARLRALDAAQQKRPGLALPLAVVKKFGEDNGGQLAGLVAYYAFFCLFPLLLVLVAILGLVLQGDPTLQDRIVDSSLASFPVIGPQIHMSIHSLNAGGLPLAIGLVATLLGGLGVTRATQVAQDRLWGVATDKRNSWLRTRTRGLTLLAVLGAVQVVTTVLDGFVVAGSQSIPATIGALLISLILDLGLFTAVFVLLTSYPATVREVLPGAVLATLLWELLQHAGSYLVVHELHKLTNTYGLFALVLGTLAWMHLGAQATLYAAQFNVVRSKGLWPRALFD
jgi:YihY family inner membrane protein